jgi:hypothetical protein
MTSEKETIEQFNQCIDELLEHKTFDPDVHHENMAILRLGESLRAMDFSSESKTRHRLRQKLLNELVLQQSPQNGTRSLPRLSITWLVAVFVLIVAVSILMSIQSNDSPSYSSLIGQPQNTPTTEPVLLTITPMVADTNATVMAMPSVTPASTSRTSTMRLEDVVTTFHISHFPLGDYQVVVIATQDIPANTVLEAEMLTEALIPTEIAPPWGYSSVELLVGLTVATNISQWSPIASEIRHHL